MLFSLAESVLVTSDTGVALGVVVTVVACTWVMATKMSKLTSAMHSMKEDFDQMKAQTYTKAEAAEVALRTALMNPDMKVPDPRDPDKILGPNTEAS